MCRQSTAARSTRSPIAGTVGLWRCRAVAPWSLVPPLRRVLSLVRVAHPEANRGATRLRRRRRADACTRYVDSDHIAVASRRDQDSKSVRLLQVGCASGRSWTAKRGSPGRLPGSCRRSRAGQTPPGECRRSLSALPIIAKRESPPTRRTPVQGLMLAFQSPPMSIKIHAIITRPSSPGRRHHPADRLTQDSPYCMHVPLVEGGRGLSYSALRSVAGRHHPGVVITRPGRPINSSRTACRSGWLARRPPPRHRRMLTRSTSRPS